MQVQARVPCADSHAVPVADGAGQTDAQHGLRTKGGGTSYRHILGDSLDKIVFWLAIEISIILYKPKN